MQLTRTPKVSHRTVPIVISGATFAVTIRWNDNDWEGFEVDDIQPVSGQTFDPQGYTRDDVADAISEKCMDMLDEIVAGGLEGDSE